MPYVRVIQAQLSVCASSIRRIDIDPILEEPLGFFAMIIQTAIGIAAGQFMGVGFAVETDDFASLGDFGRGE